MAKGVPDAGGQAVGQARHGKQGWLFLGNSRALRPPYVTDRRGGHTEGRTSFWLQGRLSGRIGTSLSSVFSTLLGLQGAQLPEKQNLE